LSYSNGVCCLLPPLLLQVCYTMDLGQFGASAKENFYFALNKALQQRDPETMSLLNGCHSTQCHTCIAEKAQQFFFVMVTDDVPKYATATSTSLQEPAFVGQGEKCACSDLSVCRYLHFFFGALRDLPKETEAVFFRGVKSDACKARSPP
jgi:hypothetical protein